jgi:excisionase family DNA binding protein
MERLLTLGEVADQLGVPEASLRYWRHIGTGPPSIKVGRHVRYRPTDINAWLRAHTTPASA